MISDQTIAKMNKHSDCHICDLIKMKLSLDFYLHLGLVSRTFLSQCLLQFECFLKFKNAFDHHAQFGGHRRFVSVFESDSALSLRRNIVHILKAEI